MAITLPAAVAPNELIQSAWGNSVVSALDELDDEKLNLAGGEMTGALTVNHPSSGTSVILKAGDETPRLRWQSQAGTDLATAIATASSFAINTLNNNTLFLQAPTEIETGSGSNVLNLKAATETPRITLESTAGTDLMWFTAGVATSFIDTFDDLQIRTNGGNALAIDGGTQRVTMNAAATVTGALLASSSVEIDGALNHDGTTVGLYGATPVVQNTGWTTFTNLTPDKTCDANATTTAELADILGTLIEALKDTGIIAA